MDNFRPIYHFLPEKNWMNDPNGVIYYKGEYHLFYQYNPSGDTWGNIHWGHAKSRDLVRWEILPIALFPSKDKGELHCFSGCAVINKGEPTIFYTSVGEGKRNCVTGAEQWMAVSHDDMLTWDKYQGNPVLTLEAHRDSDITEWRDPFVWKEENTWFMILGGSYKKRGCILIYNSQNLINWEFLNILHEGSEEMWECPNCFKLGDKFVLVYSPISEVKYCIGTINKEYRFVPEYTGVLDPSGKEDFYAPNSLIDDKGRRIMWGWITEAGRGELKGIGSWAGVQSIPRILDIKNGRLTIKPAPELKCLRKNLESYRNITITDSLILEKKGRALEVIVEIQAIEASLEFSIDILCSEDDTEKTSIIYDNDENTLSVDRTKSSSSDLCHNSKIASSVITKEGETLLLHIFVDYSVLELFVNYDESISTRIYPIKQDSEMIKIRVIKGKKLNIKTLDIWEMSSIWESRERL